ncbi:MAG: acylphosphatase [Planctomycetota bacterium]
MPERRRVLFAGHVQGVGFRYTTHRIASGHAVTGFVRNLPDGRVELVLEGLADECDQVLAEVREVFSGSIRSESSDTGPATGENATFEVRRHL